MLESIKEEDVENENGKFASRHRVLIAKIEHVVPTTKSRTVKLPYLQLQKFGGNLEEFVYCTLSLLVNILVRDLVWSEEREGA